MEPTNTLDESYAGPIREHVDAVFASLDSAASNISPVCKPALDKFGWCIHALYKPDPNQNADAYDKDDSSRTSVERKPKDFVPHQSMGKVSLLHPMSNHRSSSGQEETNTPSQDVASQPECTALEEPMNPGKNEVDYKNLASPTEYFPSVRPRCHRKAKQTLTQSDDETGS